MLLQQWPLFDFLLASLENRFYLEEMVPFNSIVGFFPGGTGTNFQKVSATPRAEALLQLLGPWNL